MAAPMTKEEYEASPAFKAGVKAKENGKKLAEAVSCLRPGHWMYDAFIAGYDSVGKAKSSSSSVEGARTKTDRFLTSFKAVDIQPEHRNHGDETPCLRDCGIAPAIASKLIAWAENDVPHESLVCTLETMSGRTIKTWHWMAAFLQAAFKKHTELFGEDDLPAAARRMRDTGSCFAA